MEVILKIDRREVLERVASGTAYTGAKSEGDPAAAADAWRRVSTVEEDAPELSRFWDECRSELCSELAGLVKEEGMDGESYSLSLDVSGLFDPALMESMRLSLFSFFATGLLARWYVYVNKGEAGAYADKAALWLEDLHRKARFKRRPARP